MSSYGEIEAFLNESEASKPRRRGHHLPRERYGVAGTAFFLTMCARHHGEPFRGGQLAMEVVEAIKYRQGLGTWKVYAYRLMPDHLHLVVELGRTENALTPDLLTQLGQFRSYTTRAAWGAGLQGRLWQHDQYDRLLRDDREFSTRCRYVLDNPVRKGWVEDWTEWRHSGILEEW